MKFKIFDTSEVGTGTELWSSGEIPVDVDVYNGLFRYVIGSDGGDLSSIDWTAGQELYLEVKVETDILTPREEIYAYPYAINTHFLEGKTTDYFLNKLEEEQTKRGNLTIEGILDINVPDTNIDALKVHSGNTYGLYVSTAGNVGIGTTSPEATLQVNGTMKIFGGWVDMTDAAGGGAVQGPATTDGFVSAGNENSNARVTGYTDGNNTPQTRRVDDCGYSDAPGGAKAVSIMMPVRKRDYWRVTGATYVYWIPLGSQ